MPATRYPAMPAPGAVPAPSVVTISIIFSGYQIAFNHKRISEVATILLGGVLIGAAAQIAKMLIGDTGNTCSAAVLHILQHYA